MFEHPLEELNFLFAKRIRVFCRNLKTDVANIEGIMQLVRLVHQLELIT